MGYYVKRFFGKKIEEPRDPDFVFTVDCRTKGVYLFYFRPGPKNVVIDWGNGITSKSTSSEAEAFGGNYFETAWGGPGIYQIRIKGSFPGIYPDSRYVGRIISLDQWGTNEFTTMEGMFKNEINMEANYTDSPNTSNVTSMRDMFYGCSKFNGEVNFDTQNVTTMRSMFYNCPEFNQKVNFDTQNVTTMQSMFYGCAKFNQKVNFNTSNVTNMRYMFYKSQITSLDLSSFDTSNVTNMEAMFYWSQVTSLDLLSFDTSNVVSMKNMFSRVPALILDLSSFDTSKVTDTTDMFRIALATTGYARTQADADKFNKSRFKPDELNFIVKPQ